MYIWIEKLNLLLWKNFLLQKRHKWQTFFEIFAPVIFSLILILIRCLVDPVKMPATEYTPFNPMKFNKSDTFWNASNARDATVAFSPENPLTRDVTSKAMSRIVEENFGMLSWLAINLLPSPIGFKNRAEMENAMIQPGATDTIMCGIVFDDEMAEANVWPDHVRFSLRFPATMRTLILEHPIRASWRTNLLFPVFARAGPRDPEDFYGGKHPGYYHEAFLALQQAISQQLIIEKSGEDYLVKNTRVQLQRYPHNAYKDDKILIALERFMSFIIMLCFLYSAVNTVKVIAVEKELQLKETMSIMGLPSWLQWLAWFIKQFSFLSISAILITILFKIPWKVLPDGDKVAVLTYTPWTVFLFFMLLFIAATLTFCFMISVFFKRASTAASFMSMAWLIAYSGYMLTQELYEQTTFSTKMLLCLFSNSAMGYALQMIVICEGTTRGLQWSDIFQPVSYHDNFTPGHVMLMMMVDTVLYMLITVYVEKIRPGAYGVPLPWYFLFTKSFWVGGSGKDLDYNHEIENADYQVALLKVVHDEEPENGTVGVNIKNLTKIYKDKKKAVDSLNLRMYQDEITVLLGHNGAGKTTTISMLTGMIPPTTGSATIDGHDIVQDTKAARKSLGLCPQHNVLFPDLTVVEHIRFYSRLKGLAEQNVAKEIEHFISVLGLEKKRDTPSCALSGGQQRRLSVCAAMCANSKVVLLDEPSSGLDPVARRALWDLLLREKKGRTIILSTHFMDEADVLGDRIAIISGGKLQCVGTPIFLKQHYGAGYKLTVVKGPYCKKFRTLNLLRKYVPEAKFNTDIGTELTYMLPQESAPNFHHMLKELESRSDELGIASFGLSITTLEEVFMKAGAEGTMTNGVTRRVSTISLTRNASVENITLTPKPILQGPIEKVKGNQLQKNHIKAMFLKLGYTILRNRLQNLIQIVIPIVNVVLTVLIVRSWKFLKELPPLELSLNNGFMKTQTLLSYSSFLKKNNPTRHMMNAYRDYFYLKSNTSNSLVNLGINAPRDFYLDLATTDPRALRYEVLIGATFEPSLITAWFSNYGYHDSAISLAIVNDAMMRSLNSRGSLTVHNEPLPYTLQNQMEILLSAGSVGFQFAVNLGSCMAFVTAFIVLFSIKERVSGAKLLQRVSGVKPIVMWGCALAADWLWMMVISTVIVVTIAMFQEQTLSTGSELGRVYLVFMVFNLATVPIHYLAALMFEIPASGFTKMCYLNTFTGVMAYMTTEIMAIPEMGSPFYYKIFDRIFSFLPSYSLSRCIKSLSDISFAIQACDGICDRYTANIPNCTRELLCNKYKMQPCCIGDNPYFRWEKPGIGRYLFVMLLVFIFAFSILMIIEYELVRKYLKKYIDSARAKHTPPSLADEDSDVTRERALAESLDQDQRQTYSLVTDGLTKYYRKHLAVDRLSMTVKRGECFGLLGVNGAGKTTTFKMLTGDLHVTSGDAWVQGHSIITDLKNVHQNIAYCPQFDALLENLTGRETMRIFCLLRGVPVDIGNAIAEELTNKLGMQQHLDKKVYEYSGGTKRKLSTALALLGDAPLIYLDEPTTGMDPASKRLVWRVILDALGNEKKLKSGQRSRRPSTYDHMSDSHSARSRDSNATYSIKSERMNGHARKPVNEKIIKKKSFVNYSKSDDVLGEVLHPDDIDQQAITATESDAIENEPSDAAIKTENDKGEDSEVATTSDDKTAEQPSDIHDKVEMIKESSDDKNEEEESINIEPSDTSDVDESKADDTPEPDHTNIDNEENSNDNNIPNDVTPLPNVVDIPKDKTNDEKDNKPADKPKRPARSSKSDPKVQRNGTNVKTKTNKVSPKVPGSKKSLSRSNTQSSDEFSKTKLDEERNVGDEPTGLRGVVLTSHSMEECEALCSRLTVMVNGRLHCMGSLQHLKNKFSAGYTLTVKCKSGEKRDANVQLVHQYVASKFKDPKLVETYQGISTYYLPDASVPWSTMFECMEKARNKFAIEDYTLTQTSLEQVFLRLTKHGYKYDDDEILQKL